MNIYARVKSSGTFSELGFQIAQRDGLSGLTSRKLAAEAGTSASAISGRSGAMQELRLQVAQHAHRALSQWRLHLRSNLEAGLASVSVEGFTLGAVLELSMPLRGLAILEAELLSAPGFADFLASEREAVAFWPRCFRQLDCDDAAATIWTDFIFGIMPLALLETNSASLLSWLPLLIQRLGDRLAKRPVVPEHLFPVGAAPQIELAIKRPSGAQKILDAAIDLMGELGVEQMTQRRIAQRAGLSLGASTYFFPTKSDLIIAAVEELSRRNYARVSDNLEHRFAVTTLLDDHGQLCGDIKAILTLHAAVARDPALRTVAPVLRDLRGPITAKRLRHAHADADRVDAFLWAATLLGSLHPCRIPRKNAVAMLETRHKLHLNSLFLAPT